MEPGLREEKKNVDSETVSVWMCLDWGGRRSGGKKNCPSLFFCLPSFTSCPSALEAEEVPDGEGVEVLAALDN